MAKHEDVRIVGLCGSLRDESKTRIALEEILDAAQAPGVTTELVDLRSYVLPGVKRTSETVEDAETLRQTVASADSIVLGSPNYHGSYSGVLKNALDYCGRDEFAGKTVGLVEVAGGSNPGTALVHLRTVSRTLNAWTLPTEIAIPNSRTSITSDGFATPELAERARRLSRELVRYAGVSTYEHRPVADQ